MSGFNADFNQNGNSVFENVYIYGWLDYDFYDNESTFKKLTVREDFTLDQDLIVKKESWFGGIYQVLDDGYWSDELTTPKEKKAIKKLGY